MAEQHTVTIEGVKYDYNQAMADPVLKAKYGYAAGDPKGVTKQGMIDAYESGPKTEADTLEFNQSIADYESKYGALKLAADAVQGQPITAQPSTYGQNVSQGTQ